MPTIAIPAHFDGKQIVLDEPYDLPTNAGLLVTVLPAIEDGITEQMWLNSTAKSSAFEFLSDEAEDIYTLADGTAIRRIQASQPQD
jgi:hypothetical protein